MTTLVCHSSSDIHCMSHSESTPRADEEPQFSMPQRPIPGCTPSREVSSRNEAFRSATRRVQRARPNQPSYNGIQAVRQGSRQDRRLLEKSVEETRGMHPVVRDDANQFDRQTHAYAEFRLFTRFAAESGAVADAILVLHRADVTGAGDPARRAESPS